MELRKITSNSNVLPEDTLVYRIGNKIRNSLDLSQIMDTATAEIRSLLGSDRVVIYQFAADATGTVIAESVVEEKLPSLKGLRFPADDIPPQVRAMYLTSHRRSVVNLSSGLIGISTLPDLDAAATQQPEIEYRSVNPCHAQYLLAMGVNTSIVLPIIMESLEEQKGEPPALEYLWGLVVCHSCESQSMSVQNLPILQAVVDQLVIAITQANLLAQSRLQAEYESLVNKITTLLHAQPTLQLSTALESIVTALQGIGGRVYLTPQIGATHPEANSVITNYHNHGELFTWGKQPEDNSLETSLPWQQMFGEPPQIVNIINVFTTEIKNSFSNSNIRGLISIPLFYRDSCLGYLSIFREEMNTEILWAGQFDPDQKQLYARKSFATWRELKQGACQEWTREQLKLFRAIANQMAMAIAQYRLYQQIQTINSSLEVQVSDRTAKLTQSLKAQAELLARSQQQATQLAQTLEDLKQTQSQLLQTEKMSSLGQLVAGVAHEINNPVNFIYGNISYTVDYTRDLLELLKLYQRYHPQPEAEIQAKAEEIDLEFLSEDVPKVLDSMKVGVDRIRQLVLSLRNFSRLDQTERKSVDIHEGIDSTLVILQHRFKARNEGANIQLIKDYGDLPLIDCYAGQLNQVFMNLLSNAIDALDTEISGVNPTISIRTYLIYNSQGQPQKVAIEIADNGSGIAPEAKSRIFDPFFTTKPIGKGTGLGLSISYQIVVEKHQGQLICDSQLGQGTKFTIELPVY